MKHEDEHMGPMVIRPDIGREFYTKEGCFILESWNDPRDASVSIARARMKPGVSTQPHRLMGIVERYVMLRGRGTVHVGERDPEVVGPGDIVVVPEEVRQWITNDGNQDLIFYCICTPRFAPEHYEALP